MTRDVFGIVTLIATVMLVAPPASAVETVKMGDLPAISNAGLYVAMDKGYFQEKSPSARSRSR